MCQRTLRSSQISMTKSPLRHPLCGLKCQLAAAHVPAEAPLLSFSNGKEPFGRLTSFSALLKVPAGCRSCASGSSTALTFQWQRALWFSNILHCASNSVIFASLIGAAIGGSSGCNFCLCAYSNVRTSRAVSNLQLPVF